MVDFITKLDGLYENRIICIAKLSKKEKPIKAGFRTYLTTVPVGLVNLAFTILSLPVRTAGCFIVNPPIKLLKVCFFNNKFCCLNLDGEKLEKLDHETTDFFSLEKVFQNALRIVTLALGIISNLVLGFFPKINTLLQRELGLVPASKLKTVPKWVENERAEQGVTISPQLKPEIPTTNTNTNLTKSTSNVPAEPSPAVDSKTKPSEDNTNQEEPSKTTDESPDADLPYESSEEDNIDNLVFDQDEDEEQQISDGNDSGTKDEISETTPKTSEATGTNSENSAPANVNTANVASNNNNSGTTTPQTHGPTDTKGSHVIIENPDDVNEFAEHDGKDASTKLTAALVDAQAAKTKLQDSNAKTIEAQRWFINSESVSAQENTEADDAEKAATLLQEKINNLTEKTRSLETVKQEKKNSAVALDLADRAADELDQAKLALDPHVTKLKAASNASRRLKIKVQEAEKRVVGPDLLNKAEITMASSEKLQKRAVANIKKAKDIANAAGDERQKQEIEKIEKEMNDAHKAAMDTLNEARQLGKDDEKLKKTCSGLKQKLKLSNKKATNVNTQLADVLKKAQDAKTYFYQVKNPQQTPSISNLYGYWTS